jgi:hypothetical protein
VPEIDVLLKRLHEHQDEVLLSKFLRFKKLDELVVLEQDIQSDQVDLLEVWIGDAVVDKVPGDKGDELAEEDALLLAGLTRRLETLELTASTLVD